ncbi:MAG: VOC family protein [Micrococcales bacterium]|nr:VOC family protein [Micrococcales bacterium]
MTTDSSDAASLAQWWADVMGGTVDGYPEAGYWGVVVEGLSMSLGFAQVDDPTPGKNRLHIDFAVEDRPAAVAALVEAGAKIVYEGSFQGMTWTTLADPDGNLFDVAGT